MRAKTSAMQARAQDSQASDLASGTSTRESFANWSPDSLSWKTSQRSLLVGWTPYSEPWPRSGTTLSGRAYERPTWVQGIDASGSSSSPGVQVWPTASAMDGSSVALGRTPETWLAESDKHAAKGQRKQFALQVAATLGMSEPQVTRARRGDWMTPTTRDWKDGACADSNVPTNGLLGRQAVRAWVTPTVEDASREGSRSWAERWASGARVPDTHQRLRTQAHWPTPDASVANDGEDLTSWLARRERVKETTQNGNGMGTPLAVAVRLPETWPTPQSSDPDGSRTLPPGTTPTGMAPNGKKRQVGLPHAAKTWPTATTGDANGSGSAGYSTASGRSEGTTLTDAAVRGIWAGTTDSSKSIKGAKLNPAWVEQLMGFPPGWTLLDPAKPKPNGKRPASSRKRRTEPTASAPSATPSSRKSRSSSGDD